MMPLVPNQEQLDLAVALRAAEHYGMNEGICNHFSLRGCYAGSQSTENGLWMHSKHVLWERVQVEDIVFISDQQCMDFHRDDRYPNNIETTAFYIHSEISKKFSSVNAILHTHMTYASAIACLEEIPALTMHQNFARFHGRLSIVDAYDGLIISQQSAKNLVADINHDNGIVLMANHGVLSLGDSLDAAFDDLYYFERACKVLITALSTGEKIKLIDEKVIEKTARQFYAERVSQAQLFFSQLRLMFLPFMNIKSIA